MRKPRRLAVAAGLSSLLAAGVIAVAASQLAHADVAGTCTATLADAFCNVTETITSPSSITITVSVTPLEQNPVYNYTLFCSLGGQSTTTSGSGSGLNKVTASVPLPYTVPDSCTISVTGHIYTGNAHDSIYVEVDFTTGTPGSGPPPPGSEHVIKGFGGKCLADKGNSSANRAKVIISTCNTSDPAQAWTYTNGGLVHDGKCANDQGNGGSGSKVILWTCIRVPNEVWFHAGRNGEFILGSTTHGLLCLTDPGYSTRNGTQLIVSTCRNTSNQHWSLR